MDFSNAVPVLGAYEEATDYILYVLLIVGLAILFKFLRLSQGE